MKKTFKNKKTKIIIILVMSLLIGGGLFYFKDSIIPPSTEIKDKNYNDDFLKYPTIVEVIDEFFDDYQFEENPNNRYLQNQFQKKPDGWHVVTKESTSKEPKYVAIVDELFWSLEKKEFNKINYPKSEGESEKKKDEYIAGFLKHKHGVPKGDPEWNSYYNIFPYYGYNEAAADVIELLKDAKNLPDSTLYALARCYSDLSFNLLGRGYGYGGYSAEPFDLANTKNCLSKEQLKKFRYYAHKAIEKFNEVHEINPNFETILGSIHTKWSSEHMSAWLDLRVYQNEQEAKKELRDDLYNPLIIDVAKNYLMSCEKDAILFTNGTNDTYPLHYVQEQFGFRKDVLIVNTSLLAFTRHINSYKDKVNEAIPMPSSIDYPHNESLLVRIQGKRMYECINAIKEIKDKNVCPKNITLRINTNIIPEKDLIEWKDKDIVSLIKFNIKSSYISQNDIALLDIFANFNWERPLYFINHNQTLDKFNGMMNFIQDEGVVSRLVPFNTRQELINIDKSYDLLMNKYSYNNIQTIQETELRNTVSYMSSHSYLGTILLRKGEDDKAILVADKYFETFPILCKWDFLSVQMMSVYIQTKQEDEYYRIDEMLKICTKKKDELESLRKLKSSDEHALNVIKQNIRQLTQFKEILADKKELDREIREIREKIKLKVGGSAITTKSGISISVINKGNGDIYPQANSTVKCHYTGKLEDGRIFDSSVQRGEPAIFGLNQVISGWTEALQLMRVGDKLEVTIPGNLAYGESGRPQAGIHPNATLIFEIELLDIL